MRKVIVLLVGVVGVPLSAWAWGARGHTLVGDIATDRLKGSEAAAKVDGLLHGLDLGFAARLPDDIKSWDPGPHAYYPESEADLAKLDQPQYQAIRDALRAFHRANLAYPPGGGERLHHQFHYTDVPIARVEKYRDGKVGRSPTDVVHMITFCVKVLKGEEGEDNAFKITKPVAVILLAHFVGDIHQPLHVGAEYFTADGRKADPDLHPDAPYYGDLGGNSLRVRNIDGIVSPEGHERRLHAIWDEDLVTLMLQEVARKIGPENPSEADDVRFLIQHAPDRWQEPASLPVEHWLEAWADESQALSYEAHERLHFTQMTTRRTPYGGDEADGVVTEAVPHGYVPWACGVVQEQISRAGLRLAALLQSCLGP
ncbi:MAG TPA: S1/P1 nuclease [Opitutaceae bacterium]|nr:S1/P1 nuclease [Opitutaceae bacterium]